MRIKKMVQSEPVMLVKVEEAKDEQIDPEGDEPSLAKAYSMEVMQVRRETWRSSRPPL